jgi:hypothetical protein
MLTKALTDELYTAGAAKDDSRRSLIKSHLQRVKEWKPVEPAGGAAGRGGGKKGQQPVPAAVERANLMMQMLAEFPQLGGVLERTGTVQKAMREAQEAHQRANQTQPSSRWHNPFASFARLVYPRTQDSARRQSADSPAMPALSAQWRATQGPARRAVR